MVSMCHSPVPKRRDPRQWWIGVDNLTCHQRSYRTRRVIISQDGRKEFSRGQRARGCSSVRLAEPSAHTWHGRRPQTGPLIPGSRHGSKNLQRPHNAIELTTSEVCSITRRRVCCVRHG
ncbi:hypothetical protein BD311DRAFT_770050 [Dichomitus squalens]|uniref:Uncharacterized protein n=1 Tax=Dichomitus squalens TaxID=114155 RepID=A0A4Q9M9K6_9APHY|nr:hypothetical protein BD311DRAFT_770050 [Dichomitus squalens]